jgi:glutamate/tyrosine decarboxylase-like PLP-dependent enzyme
LDTEEIVKKLSEFGLVSGELEIPAPQRLEILNQASQYTNQFINRIDEVRGFQEKSVSTLTINNEKHTFSDLLDIYQHEVVENGINAASAKHLGYIPGGGVYAAAIADYIAAVTNPYSGVFYASPGAAAIENEVINWIKSVFSFPDDAVGCLNSGGSISTLIAFTAARDKYKIKNDLVPQSVIYMSEQVHHSTQKALRILGLEDAIIRYIPIDEEHRIIPHELETLIKKDKSDGLNPYMIVATAGTTDTGTMDPLNQIADISERNKLWLHVDAAYGGFFILTGKKQLFNGIERADSLIVDPHKGLFLPYGVGAVIIKDREAALHSHYYTANYMQDGQNEELIKSPANLSPELTRHFRGLRVWLPLQLHGVKPFIACLEEKLLLVHYFRNKLKELNFCLGPEPDLSVSYFWYPFESDADEKNKQLMAEIHKDGSVFLSSSIIDHRFVIRIAILAFRTKKKTVDEAIGMIKRSLTTVLSQ